MVLTATFAKLDSLEIISGAAFCIIGLTNISSARLDLLFYLNNYSKLTQTGTYT